MSDLTPAVPDRGCATALRLRQIVQIFLQCRLYRELAEDYFQATTLRRAAHGADEITIRDGKRCQA